MVMFCKTVGGNNRGGRCPVLRVPILSRTSFKCLRSHSYHLICLSSTLCICDMRRAKVLSVAAAVLRFWRCKQQLYK